MQTLCWLIVAALTALGSVTLAEQGAGTTPEQILAERFQFTPKEIDQARQGQPAVKVHVEGEELTAVGAVKLPGKKERLADWLKNIEHFRTSAELGTTHVIQLPPGPEAFAGVSLDSNDLAELKQCTPEHCALRLPADVLARVTSEGTAKANDIVRQMLLNYTNAYMKTGNAAVSPEMQGLIAKAKTMTDLSPELVTYLDAYPASAPAGVDQRFYWAAMPAGGTTIVSLHHLVQYRPRPNEIWIADKSLYATRYFDAGVLAIGLYDAPDGSGFYAIAGSRVKSSQLGGAAGTVLRRQIQRSAADTVKMYLEWLHDSLSAGR
jgi:hypothetical protein